MPADFAIFDLASRRDDRLAALFPAFKPKQQATAQDDSGADDPFYAPVRAAFISKTSSRAWVDEQAVKSLGEELRLNLQHEMEAGGDNLHIGRVPLNFDSEEDEIAFTFISEALRFGSRYDRIFEAKTRNKRGAEETVQFGLIAMFISGKPPYTADNLINCSTKHEIATTFDFPIHESKSLDFASKGGVYQDVDGPLEPFASAISKCMTEMGVLLRSRQLETLGQLAVRTFQMLKDKSAWNFVKEIARALPVTFGDEQDGVSFFCKAQRLTYALHQRFPRQFPFENIDSLTGFADSYLVYSLRKLGVVKLIPELEQAIDAENAKVLSLGGKDEFALRVAALYAVRRLTQGQVLTARACDWLRDKGVTIVHQTFRHNLCATFAY